MIPVGYTFMLFFLEYKTLAIANKTAIISNTICNEEYDLYGSKRFKNIKI